MNDPHSHVKHPFIVELFSDFQESGNRYLVMEFLPNGDPRDRLNKTGPLAEDTVRYYFLQLVWALEYLHLEKHVAHRDLKCENILFDKYDNLRLIDFGLSRMSEGGSDFSSVCGSPSYVAPEIIQHMPYKLSADIWSLGIVLYAMAVGQLPFVDDQTEILLRKILEEPVTYPTFLSPHLIDLLKGLLCKKPEHRLTIDQIKTHPWFSLGQYTTMLELSRPTVQRLLEPNVDPEMLSCLTARGILPRQVAHAFIDELDNDLVLTYWIFRREQLNETYWIETRIFCRNFITKLCLTTGCRSYEWGLESSSCSGA
jgi:serine/threonine protein kinase